MLIDFTGKTALVTGGTRGIGAAVVRELLESNATVIATGTDESRIASLNGSARAENGKVRYERVDFSDDAATDAFARAMASQPIGILINNAGINKIAAVGEVDMADWDRIQRVNVRAPTVLCRAIAPAMAGRGYGRIVNISSIFGHVSRSKRASYSTSKFALNGLTRALALDYAADGVLANSVAPGFIDTDLTRDILSEPERQALAESVPLKRLGNEAEIARVVVFLASDANTFITGQSVIADGGFTSA